MLAAVLVASGCSLQRLDDLTPPYAACTADADCEPLNVRDGLAPVQCRRWECIQSFCQLPEIELPVRFEPVSVLDAPTDLHEISAADRGLLATFLRDEGGDSTMFRATVADSSPIAPVRSMLSRHDCGDGRDQPCAIVTATSAWVNEDLHVVAARVLHPDAPVWVGPVTSTAPDVTVPASAATSTISDGVAPSPDGPVAALAIAASPFDRNRVPQALVAMLVAGASPSVQVMGLWVEQDPDGVRWAQGTSADPSSPGTPARLERGPRDTEVRPAVVGLGRASSGWLLAYPASPSEIALVRIAALAEPARCTESAPPCVADDAAGNLITRVAASGERTSSSLVLSEELLAVGEIMGDVALAAAPADPAAPPAPFEVALAYRQADEIVVALATIDADVVTVDLAGARRVDAPAVRDLSLTRLEQGLAAGDSGGGYLLAWSTSENTYLARLPDGREPTAWQLNQVIAQPHAFMTATGDLHVVGATVDGTDDLVVLPAVCDPTP